MKNPKVLKQTTLLQYSSSPIKPPPSSYRQSQKRKTQQDSDTGNDSDGLRDYKLERPTSDEDSSPSSASSSLSNDDSADSDNPAPRRKLRTAMKPESEDDPDDEPAPTPARRKPRNTVKSDSEDSDNVPLTTPKARGKRPVPQPMSEEDSDELPQPKRRRLIHRKIVVVHEHTDEDSADDEDLDPDSILENRLRTHQKKSEQQLALEAYNLSRRRKGRGPTVTVPSDDEDSGESDNSLFGGARPSKTTSSEEGEDESASESDNEDDWIIEDDPIAAARLPAQFSMETHQDLGHQFKKVFQLFTHVAVLPPEQRKKGMEQLLEDEYFTLPLRMVRRKLDGLRDSAVASSVWRPEFKKALERFPEFSVAIMDFSVPECDACHLGGRTSTRKGAVSGKPYDGVGFQKQKRSPADRKLKRQFDLGRFCAIRTEVYHQYCHWEYDVFKVIEGQIDELKTGSFCKIAYAGGRKPPKDLGDADGILEWLDERGIVDNQWQMIKAMMDRARNLESENRRRGGVRD